MPDNSKDALQYKLREWARWNQSWRPKLGAPTFSLITTLMIPTLKQDGESYDKVDLWALQTIDSGIESLKKPLQDAIYGKYLLNLYNVPNLDEAEEQLLTIVTARGLLLI